MTKTKQGKSRLRWTTLVLLWVWAITIFTVVDLFLNVSEFDAIRPRANLYRGMRIPTTTTTSPTPAEPSGSSRPSAIRPAGWPTSWRPSER